jgi:hypothetical protein
MESILYHRLETDDFSGFLADKDLQEVKVRRASQFIANPHLLRAEFLRSTP